MQQRKPLHHSAWQESQQRRKARDRELSSKENRRPDDPYATLDTYARKSQCPRGEYGHLVSTRQFPGERCHHDPAAAAERRVLIVDKQDLQAAKLCRESRLSAMPRIM